MTREEAIEILNEVKIIDDSIYQYNVKYLEALDMAIEVLEQQPKTGHWIPVSERLPEEETEVLICNGNGDIELSSGSYSTEVENDFIWYTSGWRFGKVIAWMPKPAPFEPQESEEV